MTSIQPNGSERKPLGKRLRFEIFKRDGFKCRYCGATPDQRVLQVDHVVPVAGGGSNDEINLVTSCQPCNSGKSARPIEQTSIRAQAIPDPKKIREQAAQIEAYLQAKKVAEKAMEEVAEHFADLWDAQIGPISERAFSRLKNVCAEVSHEMIAKAIETTGRSKVATPGQEFSSYYATKQLKYFNAVLKYDRTGDTSWRKY